MGEVAQSAYGAVQLLIYLAVAAFIMAIFYVVGMKFSQQATNSTQVAETFFGPIASNWGLVVLLLIIAVILLVIAVVVPKLTQIGGGGR